MIECVLVGNRREMACRVDPVQTRDVLELAFAATLKAPIPERAQFGEFRM